MSTPQFTVPVAPDAAQALAFFNALYPQQRSEIVHFRGVPEPKDTRNPKNLHYALDENFSDTVRGFLDWCNVDQRAAFFLPGIVKGNGTGKADVLSLPAVLVDFDKGDPDANLAAVEALIGPATIVVESGGRTEKGPKLHAYWRLETPATGSAIELGCRVREALAVKFGGDPAFKQPAQVIRLPGSIHFKSEPKLVQLRTVRDASYELSAIAEKINLLAKPSSEKTNVVNFFDFNKVDMPHSDVERVLTAPIHEGAVDDMTRFDGAGKAIGHFIRMVREGRYDMDGAWEAVKGWNAATLVPPWDEDRLRNDFERLLRADIADKGPILPKASAVIASATPEGWSVTDWRADRFDGPSPARRWLVEGLIPLATPGLFAAVGDAGKSMLALRLALHIATAPAPNPVLDVNSPRFFGQPITGRGAAVFLTAEDDAEEIHRRLNNLDPTNARKGKPLYVVPMLSTGGARSIMIDGSHGPEPTEFWKELRTQLLAIPELCLIVLDPLSSFVNADINKDNLAGAALMTMLGELAATSGAAVMLVHHFAKATTPTNLSDARGSIRGAGALVDNGRWALVLWEADEDDAYKTLKALGQKERAKQAGVVYFGGLAKGNAPGEKKIRTLVRGPAGVLEDLTEQLLASAPKSDEVDDLIFKALSEYKKQKFGFAFAMGKTSVEKYIWPIVKRAKVDVTLRATQASVDRLMERGLIIETETPGKYEPQME